MKRLLSLFLCLLMIIGCFAGCKKKAESTYSEKTASESINTSLQQQSSSQQSTQSTISNSMDNDYVTQNKKFMNISNPRDLVEIKVGNKFRIYWI